MGGKRFLGQQREDLGWEVWKIHRDVEGSYCSSLQAGMERRFAHADQCQ